MRRYSKLILCGMSAIIFLYFASAAWVTWKMTQRRLPQRVETPPQVSWGEIEPIYLETADDEQIGAWLLRGQTAGDCVLLLHANGCSRQSMLPIAADLSRNGYTALLISFRAHGDSTGNINDFGYSGRHDVLAAVNWLEQNFPGQRIFIVGRSLGAAAAIFAADQLEGRVSGYLLEAPYKDLECAVWYRLRSSLPAPFNHIAYLGTRLWAPLFLGVDPVKISPYKYAPTIAAQSPVTMLFGGDDHFAPLSDGVQLAQTMQCPVKIITFEGATHQPLYAWDAGRYETALYELLGSWSPQSLGGTLADERIPPQSSLPLR